MGLVVNLRGSHTHDTVDRGLRILENMVHRGAEGADPLTGDGAGIMVHIPHEFILLNGIPVPKKGRYGTGLVFLPKDAARQQQIIGIIGRKSEEAGFSLLPLRPVPVDSSALGPGSAASEPDIRQIFVVDQTDGQRIEQRLYLLRKAIERCVAGMEVYIVSLSSYQLIQSIFD